MVGHNPGASTISTSIPERSAIEVVTMSASDILTCTGGAGTGAGISPLYLEDSADEDMGAASASASASDRLDGIGGSTAG